MELYKGDCLEILKQIEDKSVDLIITDPPYDVDVNHDGGDLYHNKGFDKSNIELVKSKIDNGYDIELYNTEFVRVMKTINIYIWCNKVQIPDYFNFYVNKLKCKFDILCWHKGNALPTYANKYLSDTEYCLYFRNGGWCFPEGYEDAKTFYIAPINTKDKNIYKVSGLSDPQSLTTLLVLASHVMWLLFGHLTKLLTGLLCAIMLYSNAKS